MKAIHDAHYATPADSWAEYVVRLQYLAEMRLGAVLRRQARSEDAAVAAAMEAADGIR